MQNHKQQTISKQAIISYKQEINKSYKLKQQFNNNKINTQTNKTNQLKQNKTQSPFHHYLKSIKQNTTTNPTQALKTTHHHPTSSKHP